MSGVEVRFGCIVSEYSALQGWAKSAVSSPEYFIQSYIEVSVYDVTIDRLSDIQYSPFEFNLLLCSSGDARYRWIKAYNRIKSVA